MRAYLTPQAEADLEEIGDYIALDNPRRAVPFIREIREHCEKIAEGPQGSSRRITIMTAGARTRSTNIRVIDRRTSLPLPACA